eukprot:1825-Heterococcus_DN1.PRE.1
MRLQWMCCAHAITMHIYALQAKAVTGVSLSVCEEQDVARKLVAEHLHRAFHALSKLRCHRLRTRRQDQHLPFPPNSTSSDAVWLQQTIFLWQNNQTSSASEFGGNLPGIQYISQCD